MILRELLRVAGVLQGNEPKLTERGCADQTDYGFSPVLILQRLHRNTNMNLIFKCQFVADNRKRRIIFLCTEKQGVDNNVNYSNAMYLPGIQFYLLLYTNFPML